MSEQEVKGNLDFLQSIEHYKDSEQGTFKAILDKLSEPLKHLCQIYQSIKAEKQAQLDIYILKQENYYENCRSPSPEYEIIEESKEIENNTKKEEKRKITEEIKKSSLNVQHKGNSGKMTQINTTMVKKPGIILKRGQVILSTEGYKRNLNDKAKKLCKLFKKKDQFLPEFLRSNENNKISDIKLAEAAQAARIAMRKGQNKHMKDSKIRRLNDTMDHNENKSNMYVAIAYKNNENLVLACLLFREFGDKIYVRASDSSIVLNFLYIHDIGEYDELMMEYGYSFKWAKRLCGIKDDGHTIVIEEKEEGEEVMQEENSEKNLAMDIFNKVVNQKETIQIQKAEIDALMDKAVIFAYEKDFRKVHNCQLLEFDSIDSDSENENQTVRKVFHSIRTTSKEIKHLKLPTGIEDLFKYETEERRLRKEEENVIELFANYENKIIKVKDTYKRIGDRLYTDDVIKYRGWQRSENLPLRKMDISDLNLEKIESMTDKKQFSMDAFENNIARRQFPYRPFGKAALQIVRKPWKIENPKFNIDEIYKNYKVKKLINVNDEELEDEDEFNSENDIYRELRTALGMFYNLPGENPFPPFVLMNKKNMPLEIMKNGKIRPIEELRQSVGESKKSRNSVSMSKTEDRGIKGKVKVKDFITHDDIEKLDKLDSQGNQNVYVWIDKEKSKLTQINKPVDTIIEYKIIIQRGYIRLISKMYFDVMADGKIILKIESCTAMRDYVLPDSDRVHRKERRANYKDQKQKSKLIKKSILNIKDQLSNAKISEKSIKMTYHKYNEKIEIKDYGKYKIEEKRLSSRDIGITSGSGSGNGSGNGNGNGKGRNSSKERKRKRSSVRDRSKGEEGELLEYRLEHEKRMDKSKSGRKRTRSSDISIRNSRHSKKDDKKQHEQMNNNELNVNNYNSNSRRSMRQSESKRQIKDNKKEKHTSKIEKLEYKHKTKKRYFPRFCWPEGKEYFESKMEECKNELSGPVSYVSKLMEIFNNWILENKATMVKMTDYFNKLGVDHRISYEKPNKTNNITKKREPRPIRLKKYLYRADVFPIPMKGRPVKLSDYPEQHELMHPEIRLKRLQEEIEIEMGIREEEIDMMHTSLDAGIRAREKARLKVIENRRRIERKEKEAKRENSDQERQQRLRYESSKRKQREEDYEQQYESKRRISGRRESGFSSSDTKKKEEVKKNYNRNSSPIERRREHSRNEIHEQQQQQQRHLNRYYIPTMNTSYNIDNMTRFDNEIKMRFDHSHAAAAAAAAAPTSFIRSPIISRDLHYIDSRMSHPTFMYPQQQQQPQRSALSPDRVQRHHTMFRNAFFQPMPSPGHFFTMQPQNPAPMPPHGPLPPHPSLQPYGPPHNPYFSREFDRHM